MDVSGEAADLVVKEGIQVTEAAVKLAASGVKNVAALLLALSKADYQVAGKTSAGKLQRQGVPAEVLQIKKEDIPRFQKLAKEFGILYCIAQKRGNDSGYANVISNQNYAAKLNAVYQEMGYTMPREKAEVPIPKKAEPRVPPGKFLPERGSGLNQPTMDKKPSVKNRLAAMQAALNTLEPITKIPERDSGR